MDKKMNAYKYFYLSFLFMKWYSFKKHAVIRPSCYYLQTGSFYFHFPNDQFNVKMAAPSGKGFPDFQRLKILAKDEFTSLLDQVSI